MKLRDNSRLAVSKILKCNSEIIFIKAIRENYQDPELQKQRQIRAERAKEKELEDVTTVFNAKRNTLLRQAVHADPELIETAAARTQSYIVRQRLEAHEIAYQKGGMVAAAYEDEKARILG